MSYAIVRNEKITRAEAQGRCVHNDRKAKNHANKDIDPQKTHFNFYFKKNELNYVKEFDKLKKKYDLQGMIRSNSIIICEMIFTSDDEFFKKIGEMETIRYFEESYKFICSYKNLGEQNILSAVVHFDEGTPHMHLAYVPVVHTKDKAGKSIDKVCAKDFWKGRDSYRQLQNAYFEHVTSKGFELERGLSSEETGAKHEKIENLKRITNFEKTKKMLQNMKLDLPDVPDITDINKFTRKRDEKILDEIIKPKDELIQQLYQSNIALHQELSRQARVIDEAEKYQKERDKILADNQELHNTMKHLEHEYKKKSNTLDLRFDNRKRELEEEYENKAFEMGYGYKSKISKLEKENQHLHKVVDKFKETIAKFIKWVCKKFDMGAEDNLIRKFEQETRTSIDAEKQLECEDRAKEWKL